MSGLFDSHCHLDYPGVFEQLDDVLARAREAGVARMTTIGAGSTAGSAENAVRIANQHPETIRATVGIHPHEAKEVTPEVMERIEELAADPMVVAIGETGLDYHYDRSPREQQRDAFRGFMKLCHRTKKPVVIHTREAREDTLNILREEGASEVGGVIHCFTEDQAFAEAALELGFYLSFTGIVTYPRARSILEVAAAAPADRILVETDTPFLAPVPLRGKKNEPAYVAHTARCIAAARGEDEAEFIARTYENACRFYGIED
ncbi:hypothetical protein ABI59_14370 [Acidobacteria bacterium Mor1]|nr:hypothetical protein ABI59_14370 [Acidobacteria bacterium Mor1]